MKINNKKGFTLIELVLVLSILSIVVLMGSNAVVMMFRSHSDTYSEFDLQSSARDVSSYIGETIKYSQAVFAVPSEYVNNKASMDPEWDFITLSADKKSVMRYQYNSVTNTHDEVIMIAPQDNVEYEIVFEKVSSTQTDVNGSITIENDSTLQYSIVAHNLSQNKEGDWVKSNQKIVMKSEVDALNALQVVDKGTKTSPAVALAYRKDDQTYGEGRSHVVKIGLVLDKSGSMGDYESGSSRMTHLKKALIGDGLNGTSGMVAQFAVYPNFEISIVPFSSRASGDTFYNAQLDKADIVSTVKGLVPGGGTNTGDGIRKSYYNLKDYTPVGYNSNVEEHDFTIILVDGNSNQLSYNTRDDNSYWRRGRWYYSYDYEYQLASTAALGESSGYYSDQSGFGYVTEMGRKIIEEDAYKGTYYLIGYINSTDYWGNPVESAGVKNIREALNIPSEQVYSYNDPNFDLSKVFSDIATDIMAKTWLVTGPQIKEIGGEENE